MARIRTIKPDFFTSIDVAGMSPWARLLFIGLWTHSDDDGRNLNEPLLIKAALFPLERQIEPDDVAVLMRELATVGVIDLYTDERGRALYQVKGWKDHQRIDRPKPSKYPSTTDRGCVVDASSMDRGRVVLERKGEEGSDDVPLLAEAIDAYVMSVCLSSKNTSKAYRDAVKNNVVAERLPVMRAYMADNPDATVDDLRELLGLPRIDTPAPKVTEQHPSDCPVCAGEGIKEVAPNTYAPCDGNPSNVRELRPA